MKTFALRFKKSDKKTASWREKYSRTALVLYVLSVLMLLYATFQFYNALGYIMDYVSAGSISFENDMSSILSYTTQACLSYYVYSILFYVMGKGYQVLIDIKKEVLTK